MLGLATIDGAKALILGDVTGSLTPGKSADIIMVCIDHLNTTPLTGWRCGQPSQTISTQWWWPARSSNAAAASGLPIHGTRCRKPPAQ
jgi:predicted amidohydrolase YtcJ